MQRTCVAQLKSEIEHPKCATCGAPMWLARIEPQEPGHDRRTFECVACGESTTEVVKYS